MADRDFWMIIGAGEGGGGGDTWAKDLLWENPNSSVIFEATSTDVLFADLSQYEYLEIVGKLSTTAKEEKSFICPIDGRFFFAFDIRGQYKRRVFQRNGYNMQWTNNEEKNSVSNNENIPVAVYGIKKA